MTTDEPSFVWRSIALRTPRLRASSTTRRFSRRIRSTSSSLQPPFGALPLSRCPDGRIVHPDRLRRHPFCNHCWLRAGRAEERPAGYDRLTDPEEVTDAGSIPAKNRILWNAVSASGDTSCDTLHSQSAERQPEEDEMNRISRGEQVTNPGRERTTRHRRFKREVHPLFCHLLDRRTANRVAHRS